ncbi:response regulator transcription factor [soil metagenome]
MRAAWHIALYGFTLGLLLILLHWAQTRYITLSYPVEWYVGFVAILFMGLGSWVALHLAKPKLETIVIEKPVYVNQVSFVSNTAEIEKLAISKRELEVLELMAQGMSNNEIASHLYVSLNTVKTHCKNLFEKLAVARRTQAIEKAKRLALIP